MITLSINEAQANALLKLLDAAVRYEGLAAAPIASEFQFMIRRAAEQVADKVDSFVPKTGETDDDGETD